ncbi:hypothetical protein AAFF_G00053560 [Aldrovandia affinis]|uniref:Uncharacterized protein n=1 Tax=Aldrovandia affinis TaxID=143900 RepID=A0AAD7S1E7_9TELE|nr:hypothetical protein AAFF_G00053560 [Aldrovandia affinis]
MATHGEGRGNKEQAEIQFKRIYTGTSRVFASLPRAGGWPGVSLASAALCLPASPLLKVAMAPKVTSTALRLSGLRDKGVISHV